MSNIDAFIIDGPDTLILSNLGGTMLDGGKSVIFNYYFSDESYPLITESIVSAIANKITTTAGNLGIATKNDINTAINEGKVAGISSVTASPNTWSLFTTSQIQNMAVGDLVLTRQVSGGFVLNYDIEQSTDLQTWTPYQALSLPLTGLPTDKAFVRIKAKQDGASNVSNSQTTPTTPTFGSSYDGGSGVSPNYATPNYNGGASAISPSPDWLNSLPSVPLGPIEDE
jgi:hypothetical protein